MGNYHLWKGGLSWRWRQAHQQMCLQKRGGRRIGAVVARASSAVGGDVILLFLIPTHAGRAEYSVGGGG